MTLCYDISVRRYFGVAMMAFCVGILVYFMLVLRSLSEKFKMEKSIAIVVAPKTVAEISAVPQTVEVPENSRKHFNCSLESKP